MTEKYRCPNENIISEKMLSKSSSKELWYKKRNYCISENCEGKCTELVILKKIYWELRKLNQNLGK